VKLDVKLKFAHLGEVPALAERYEALGFDGIWSSETAHDPFLPLALAAAHTSRAALGTDLAVAFARSPFAVAMAARDLQDASGGRFRLGLGTQVRAHVERRFSMPFDRPAARIKDYVRCLRAVWDAFQHGTRPAYEGEFYRFTLLIPFFDPGPSAAGPIPVYLAGVNPAMCRAAGEVADGFLCHPLHTSAYLRDVVRPALDAGARLQGKRVDDLDLYSMVFVVSGETEAERERAAGEVRRQIAFYASTPNYRAVLEHAGHGGIARELSRLARSGGWERMPALIPDDLLAQVACVAPPAALPGALRARYAGLLDRVTLYLHVPADDPDGRWRAFVSAFRQAA